MPIDTRIPLGVTGPDPNGFVNALAAGMKMRELENAADRLARKDEAAVRKSNALSRFGQSDRGPEAIRTLYTEAPEAAAGVEKNIREAEFHGARTQKLQADFAKANHQMLADATGAILANPTRENANTIMDGIEAQGGDMSRARKQLESTPDQALLPLFKGWVGNAQKVQQMALAEEKAKPKPKWDSYTGRYVQAPPGSEPTVAPPGPPAPPGRRPAMVPGEGSGYSTDEIRAEIARLDQGGAPSEHFRMSREELDGLLLAQTDLENAQGGGAALPTASVPPPTPAEAGGGPQAPVEGPPPAAGPYQTPAERDYARDQRQDAKDQEAQRIAQETLRLKQAEAAAREQRAKEKGQVQRGELLTPADASKARQKLVRIEAMKRQLQLVKDTWAGTEDDKGNVATRGIKDTMGAGPGADIYAPDFGYEAGEKFNKAIASLVASKTAITRTPGVGSMSDYEQKLDTADLPSRSTHEGTTEQQIQAYEDLINDLETGYRTLLAGPAAAPAEAGPATPEAPAGVVVSADKEPPAPKLVKVAPLEDLDSMPMPGGKYAGKFAVSPEGTRYRSDGSKWIRQ